MDNASLSICGGKRVGKAALWFLKNVKNVSCENKFVNTMKLSKKNNSDIMYNRLLGNKQNNWLSFGRDNDMERGDFEPCGAEI